MTLQKDIYSKSRFWYIIESTLEYFFSIMVGTNYLAYLATAIGIDDGTVGVLTSFVSLGCGFQILALLMKGDKPVKRFVITANVISQVCFTLLYFVPLVEIPSEIKTVAFICLLLAGHVLMNAVFSPKVNWSRRLIPADRLGRFSIVCETVSLISGMLFTFAMGSLADYFKAQGDMQGFFIVGGVTLVVLMVANAVSMLLIKEKPLDYVPKKMPLPLMIKEAFTDKSTLKLIPIFVLWNFALYGTTSFFYAYSQNDLGFNMTIISILSAAYSIVRSLSGMYLGRIGDKRSFSDMMSLGMLAFIVGLTFNSFGGGVNYWIYYMLYAITLAGTNSAKMNLIFNCVSPEKRTSAVAILYTIGGFVGFFASLTMKPIYDFVKTSGNSFLGIGNVHGAQVLSVIGIIITVLALLYLNLVVRKIELEHKSHHED